jgi:DNA anti-recombination protein RmuC
MFWTNRFNRIEQWLAAIYQQGVSLMSAISDFAAKQKAHNDDIDKHLTDITTMLSQMNATIAQLQASAGKITPEDQALLDQIEAQGKALEDKAHAMDTLVPPTPPPAP